MIEQLKRKNPGIKIMEVEDRAFNKFGKILKNFPVNDLPNSFIKDEIPENATIYLPSIDEWENTEFKQEIEKKFFGELPVQLGLCKGHNQYLNGFEFHKTSEVIVTATPLVLFIQTLQEVDLQQEVAAENTVAVFIPAFKAVEIYSTTLHLAPCKVIEDGFNSMIILPKGTNEELEYESREADEFLFKKNKWAIAHRDHQKFVDQNVPVKLVGENLKLNYR
ncbi:DUF4867 domain-containing protein [Marinococcus halophilus]|uniref:DUF4867 domain-containing protein n=1 Tax=Marinococcus halophilus TaxID=1371 RepID=A0A510Y6T5_MARHA|nr:DUF4867 family protein [Marinococcus halophilus]OZT79723.1 DUF4867 domain-containing protein [Marinococcus halophilus]GEK59079.1 DUF4867 domain-containing protein [Marinococcus halophilus]